MSCSAGHEFQRLYRMMEEEKKKKQVHTTGEKRKMSDSSPTSSFLPPSPAGTNCREVT